MNGIERNLGVFNKQLKNTRTLITFIIFTILLAISSAGLVANAEEVSTSTSEDLSPRNKFENERMRAQARIASSTISLKTNRERITAQQMRTATSSNGVRSLPHRSLLDGVEKITERLTTATGKFYDVVNKVQNRADELSFEDVDISAVNIELDIAYEALTNAEATIANIGDIAASIDETSDPSEIRQEFRQTYDPIRGHLRTAKDSLHKAIEALKVAVRESELDRGVSAAVRNENSALDTDMSTSTNE